MFEAALQGVPAGARTVVVGDSPDTDVAGAHRAGLPAVLVGASGPTAVAGDPRRPDAVIPGLASVLEAPTELETSPAVTFPPPRSIAPGVAAVVFDGDGRVLLGRRTDRGQWGLPSGHVEDFVTTCFACRVVGGRLEPDGWRPISRTSRDARAGSLAPFVRWATPGSRSRAGA